MDSECQPGRGLKRQIGPVALLFTGITGIVGSGWLFASLYAAQLAGPAAILSWCIGGTVAVLLALVYAELGGMLPVAGAIARIPYYSHGGMSGFMAGWLCWIAYVATAPIEVSAVLQYASNYLPWLCGPFAAFAAILGMQWLAAALYFDAVLSPSGTAIAYIGATARINYALAQNEQFPSLFLHLNRASVPMWALLFNFVLGLLLFLPFPGWAELVGFISSAAVLSLAFGPVSMAALRHQLPDEKRPVKLRAGMTLSAISFVLVGCVVYWSGWDTNWKVFGLAFAGALLLGLLHWRRGDFANLNLRQSAWFWLFIAGLAVISYAGNYGNGLKLLGHGSDMALVTALSLGVFWLAFRTRLPAARTVALVVATPPELD